MVWSRDQIGHPDARVIYVDDNPGKTGDPPDAIVIKVGVPMPRPSFRSKVRGDFYNG